MTTAGTLRAAARLIAPPGAWLPVSFLARAADGRAVPPRSQEAVAWGALGALVAVRGASDTRIAELAALKAVVGKPVHFCDWHSADGRTQGEVVDAMERAAAWAERSDDRGFPG